MSDINRSEITGLDETGDDLKGDPREFFGLGIVCFLDLLGFSKSVLENWSDETNSPLARLLRIKSCANLTDSKHNMSFCVYRDGPDGKPIRPHGSYRARVETFSDSITVCVALPPKATYVDMFCASAALIVLVNDLWLATIEEGFTLRGAVEVGQVYWSGSEIIGPAFVTAYHLENQIAKTSRVILGKSFSAGIRNFMSNPKLEGHPMSELLPFLGRCGDEVIALKPMLLIKNGKPILERIKAMQNTAQETKHKEKYLDLLSWLETPDSMPVPDSDDFTRYICALETQGF